MCGHSGPYNSLYRGSSATRGCEFGDMDRGGNGKHS